MSLGILAIIIALVCAVITVTAPQDDRKDQTTDYNKIYETIAPKEI
jgi:hypothetical protein